MTPGRTKRERLKDTDLEHLRFKFNNWTFPPIEWVDKLGLQEQSLPFIRVAWAIFKDKGEFSHMDVHAALGKERLEAVQTLADQVVKENPPLVK